MKKNQNFLLYIVAVFMLTLFSCEDGEDGAIGPQGPQGEQGIPGVNGQDGEDGEDASANDQETTADVFSPILGEVMGTSTLVRSTDRIMASFETTNLTPGHAYTLWWIVINQPENCADTPCGLADVGNPDTETDLLFGSGRVADESGMATFSAVLLENDGSGSINDILGLPVDVGGLLNAQTAQVQLVLRSHGPAIAGMVNTQISSYGGGCTVFFQPFEAIPDVEGECGDIQVSAHLPM